MVTRIANALILCLPLLCALAAIAGTLAGGGSVSDLIPWL